MAMTLLWVRLQSWMDWLIFLGIAAVVIFLMMYLQKRRRQGMEKAAQEMGFSFQAEGEDLTGDFLRLPLLEGNSGLSNVLRGSVATGEAVVLDCRIGSGKSSQTQTVACLRLAGKRFPGFELRPENIFHKIGAAFGYKDINFQGNEGFSKSYLLRGQDEAAVRAIFHPGVLMFFEQHPGWSVEGAGEWLAVYKRATITSPSKIRDLLDNATQMANAFS